MGYYNFFSLPPVKEDEVERQASLLRKGAFSPIVAIDAEALFSCTVFFLRFCTSNASLSTRPFHE